jgi:hypothetical protein
MMVERALLGLAIVVALLGLVDPAISLPWRARPVVAIQIAAGADATADTARDGELSALATRVRTRLAREFDVREVNTSATASAMHASAAAATTDAPATGDSAATTSSAAAADAPASGYVLIGADAYPGDLSLPAGIPLVAIRPATKSEAGVRILNVTAPSTLHVTSQLHVAVSLAARGQRGRSSAIVLRADDLELARATHAWTQDDERATVTLDAAPLRTGVTRFSVALALASSASATRSAAPAQTASSASASATATAAAAAASSTSAPSAASSAASSAPTAPLASGAPAPEFTSASAPAAGTARVDFGVDVTDRPLRVLFVDARPSWATRFIRLALEADARFRVDSLAQVSRGLSARTADAPPRVTLAALTPFDVVIAGAPDLLSSADVDALRTFARARGGLIVFAPDRLPQGPFVSLLPTDRFDERLLDAPQTVAPEAALSADARLLASEFALPHTLHAGARTLARLATGGATHAAIVTSPLGDGQVIFAGALDAWRYRDRDQQGFDRLWRQLIATFGADAPAPIEITLDPLVSRPGTPITIRARWRRDLLTNSAAASTANAAAATATATAIAATTAPMTVRASFSPALAQPAPAHPPLARTTGASSKAYERPALPSSSEPSASGEPSAAGGEPIRLWPGDQPGEFRGTLNAPARAGVYAMSLDADAPSTHATAVALVLSDVPPASASWDGLRAAVESRGGGAVTEDEIDRAIAQLRRQLAGHASGAASGAAGGSSDAPRHPWRSAWWIVPFAGCLGGEWLLRRRRGEA